MNKEEYLRLVKQVGFKVGDRVTLIRKPTTGECVEYGCGIRPHYLDSDVLNKSYQIIEITERKNCYIFISDNRRGDYYYIPQFCFAEFNIIRDLQFFSKSKFKEFDTKVTLIYGH